MLFPRIMDLLVKEHELVSLDKYSDLLSYQFYPTKTFRQTKQLQVLTLPPWSQYYFLGLTDGIKMPDRHKAPACTKTPTATRNELLAFPSICSCWSLVWNCCWSQKKTHSGRHSSMTSKPKTWNPSFKIQVFKLPPFLIFSLLTQVILAVHYHLSLFLSPCILHSLSVIM